jgi:hypothetical protein
MLVSMTCFDDCEREDASQAKLDLEISLLGSNGSSEVVLLEAQNEDHLRTTHRRYFESFESLKARKVEARSDNP